MKVILSILIFTLTSISQESSFLNQKERQMLINEISGDRAFEHIRVLTQWHRNSGMDGYFKAADYVVEQAKKNGLVDVKFVEQPLGGRNYTAISGELWITEPIEYKLADMGDHALMLSDGSHSADVENAELVFIGKGSKAELEDLDVKGKIVLINGNPGTAVNNAVFAKGAIGVICYTTSEEKSMMDFPDQLPWTRIFVPEGKTKTFAFNISPRRGEQLRMLLESNREADWLSTGNVFKGGKLKVSAKVKTKFGESRTGRTGFVEGFIRGSKYHDQQIVLTAHLQEEQGSANDDGSGSGNILELARVINKLIAEGKMERPLRDIRFWWTDEIYSEYRYFSDFPEEPAKIMVNLHQDMTGAKQSIGNRVQHMIYAPHSITSYLDAMFEDIGTFVVMSNNPFIQAGRIGKYPRPHSVEIYSTRGTRENFAARFVPFFNASDNLNFVEGAIGVPSIGLINWDDFYIHSSDDDLWQVDQTQLKRNNFIIASLAYFIGKATEDDVPLILSETYGQSIKRLATDLDHALIELQKQKSKTEAWNNAFVLIEQGIEREIRAIHSVKDFDLENKHNSKYMMYVNHLETLKSQYMDQISSIYKSRFNENAPKNFVLDKSFEKYLKMVPSNHPVLAKYFQNRGSVARAGIHRTVRFELFNMVNGKRNFVDIYKALKAETLHATRFLYDDLTLEMVIKVLESAVEKDAIRL